jgi:hypothetical protein
MGASISLFAETPPLTGDELKLVGGAVAGTAFTWRRAK